MDRRTFDRDGATAVLDPFERAHDAWSGVVRSPELQRVARALDAAGVSVEECVSECAAITEVPTTQKRLAEIRNAIIPSGVAPGAFEKFVIGHAALRYESALESAPVTPAVKRLTAIGVSRFADDRTILDIRETRFIALCKMTTLRRFAAGQFDWENSGLPRSWLPRVRPRSSLVRLLSMIAREWHGFGPAFFVHIPVTYPVHALFEREARKAYYRMARSMALQPRVKGLIASSWLHSPATLEISPHLAWLNSVFRDHGAVIATMGAASPDSGVLAQSAQRQRAFDEGRFRPTIGLIVWSRYDALAWAAQNRELEDAKHS